MKDREIFRRPLNEKVPRLPGNNLVSDFRPFKILEVRLPKVIQSQQARYEFGRNLDIHIEVLQNNNINRNKIGLFAKTIETKWPINHHLTKKKYLQCNQSNHVERMSLHHLH